MTITINSEPVYTAVLLDLETVEALQEQLNVPLLSQETNNNNDDHDDHVIMESNKTTNTVKVLNFLTGLCVGVMFSCAGFAVLIQHWHTMGHKDVMLFSIVWSSVTSVAAYLLFSLLYIGTCSYFGPTTSSCRSNLTLAVSNALESERTISMLEYCFAVGVFLGFCGACTWTDVAYGMPASSILLTVVVATVWATLMVYCAMVTSRKDSDEQQQYVQPRGRKGTVLPMIFV
jgi:hypothetical protein